MAIKTLAFDSPAESHVHNGQHIAEACEAAITPGRDERNARTNILSRPGCSSAFPIE